MSILDLDFGNSPEKLKTEYLDMYKGIQSELISTTRFDENSDLSTTYVGRINLIRTSKIKVEEKFPISEQGYMIGKLLDGTECQILLDTESANHLCPNHIIYDVNHYIHCQNLLLKFKEFKYERTIC